MAPGPRNAAHVVAASGDDQLALVLVETIEVDDDEPIPDVEPVPVAGDVCHDEGVDLALVIELYAAVADVVSTRAATARGGQE